MPEHQVICPHAGRTAPVDHWPWPVFQGPGIVVTSRAVADVMVSWEINGGRGARQCWQFRSGRREPPTIVGLWLFSGACAYGQRDPLLQVHHVARVVSSDAARMPDQREEMRGDKLIIRWKPVL